MPTTHDSKPFVFARGPLIVSLESVFWHIQRYPRRRVAPGRPPLYERAAPRELEQPYRRGEGRVLRFPLTRRALVVGYWVPELEAKADEDKALVEAIDGAHLPGITATEIKGWTPAADVLSWWDRLRERVRQWLGVEDDDPMDDAELGWYEDDEYVVIPWKERA